MNTYSLWIVPDDTHSNVLQQKIDYLKPRLKGANFFPHITIIGKLKGELNNITIRCQKIAQKYQEVLIKLSHIETQERYFRAMYYKVLKTETLEKLYRELEKEFEQDIIKKDDEYMPHLSLLYSDVKEEEKKLFIKKIEKNTPYDFLINKIHIINLDTAIPESWRIQQSIKMGEKIEKIQLWNR